ncbi:MAG TPA: methyltransferase domain-containing protein [Allosphingosinicella sp.]|nr:methyltransferase domain-containing protein [Allosphingosinicella sp.]
MELTRREILAAAALPALAGFAAPELEVPFVPTPHSLVQRMLDLAQIGPSDYLIDLGCGDGRIAVAAAQRGARALGVDLDPLRIAEAAAAARIAGVEARVRFRRQDLFRTPIYDADVVALYLLPRLNLALRPRLLTELRPGSRIVSHAFDMGDWRPEAEETHDGRRIYLWIVPAVAGGSWALTEGDGSAFALEIEQRYQEVSGTLTGGGRVMDLRGAVLRGTSLAFTVDAASGPRLYRGVIDGAAIVGETGWRALRLG